LYSISGCTSKPVTFNKTDSEKIDALIKVRKLNDNAILVSFGYDAVTAINTGEGIVVVDGGISNALTARYRKLIEKEFHRDDFTYVINTHGHHDHIGGNSVFPHAKVIGHDNFPMESPERWTNPEKSMISFSKLVEDYDQKLKLSVQEGGEWDENFTQKIRCLSAYMDAENHVPVKLPDITFSDSMKLETGDTAIEMIYFGEFHSHSDIIIYVPETRVLFTGDLFSKYGRPSINDLSPGHEERWFRAVKWIEKRLDRIEIVIAGHGEILSIDDLNHFSNNISSKYSGQGDL
jgi:glyoxylase-like metal-dependent hydrolase (beta-lactamase superfamily II)